MDIGEVEGDHGAPLLRPLRSVELEPLDALQGLDRVPQELDIMTPHLLHPDLRGLLDRREKADGTGDVCRSRLELVRHVVPLRTVQVHLPNHLATSLEWGHLLKQLPPSVEDSDPSRAQHLVPGEGKEVATDLADADGHMGAELVSA